MTLVSDIIFSAYRENNLVSINGALTTPQENEALKLLQSILSTTFKNEVGENLTDWPVGNLNVNWPNGWNAVFWQYPIINSRIIYNVADPQTLWLPYQPSDGSMMAVVPTNGNLAIYPLTLAGNGRLIDGANSITLTDDSQVGTWFYRADLGNWIKIDQLSLTGDMPFPSEFDDYFQTMLSMRLNPRYNNVMVESTAQALSRWKRQLSARYKQIVVTPADPAVLKLSEYDATSFNGNGPYGWFGPNGWGA